MSTSAPTELYPQIGAQSRLHMAHLDVQLGGRQGPGHHRVGVSLHQDGIGPLGHEHLFHAGHYPPGLLAVMPRAHIQVVLGLREFQLLEEDPVHLVGVVLAGVDHAVVQAAALAFPDHRSHFDDLRPGTEDDCNGHVDCRLLG